MKTRFGRFFVGLVLTVFGHFLVVSLAVLSPVAPAAGFFEHMADLCNKALTRSNPVATFLLPLGVVALLSGYLLMIWGVVSKNPRRPRVLPVRMERAREPDAAAHAGPGRTGF
jgi:hypothetical protein